MAATAQTDRQLGRHRYVGPPLYSLTLSARSGPDPLGSYCHPSYIGRQTGVNPCGLLFAYPPIDRSGTNLMLRRRICGFNDLTKTRGLELAAEHETGKLLRDYADENSRLILGRTPQPPTNTTARLFRRPGHRDKQETLIPDVSDFVPRTKPGQPPGSH